MTVGVLKSHARCAFSIINKKTSNEEVGEAEVDSIKGRTPKVGFFFSSPTSEIVGRTLSRSCTPRFVHIAVHEQLSTACNPTVNFAMSSNSTHLAISAALYAGFCMTLRRFGSVDPNFFPERERIVNGP
jgi:hypothetical protein